MNTQVNFRTNKKTLAKADQVFRQMGMDRSTALNMFLSRVEAEEGLPFRPTANQAVLRAKWDKEVKEAMVEKGYKSPRQALRQALR